MPAPKIKVRKKPTNKRCEKGFPCKTTCISRAKNCKEPLRGQARTFALWEADQMERLAITNKKREKAGLTPARLNDSKYITAERTKLPQSATAKTTEKVSDAAIAPPQIDKLQASSLSKKAIKELVAKNISRSVFDSMIEHDVGNYEGGGGQFTVTLSTSKITKTNLNKLAIALSPNKTKTSPPMIKTDGDIATITYRNADHQYSGVMDEMNGMSDRLKAMGINVSSVSDKKRMLSESKKAIASPSPEAKPVPSSLQGSKKVIASDNFIKNLGLIESKYPDDYTPPPLTEAQKKTLENQAKNKTKEERDRIEFAIANSGTVFIVAKANNQQVGYIAPDGTVKADKQNYHPVEGLGGVRFAMFSPTTPSSATIDNLPPVTRNRKTPKSEEFYYITYDDPVVRKRLLKNAEGQTLTSTRGTGKSRLYRVQNGVLETATKTGTWRKATGKAKGEYSDIDDVYRQLYESEWKEATGRNGVAEQQRTAIASSTPVANLATEKDYRDYQKAYKEQSKALADSLTKENSDRIYPLTGKEYGVEFFQSKENPKIAIAVKDGEAVSILQGAGMRLFEKKLKEKGDNFSISEYAMNEDAMRIAHTSALQKTPLSPVIEKHFPDAVSQYNWLTDKQSSVEPKSAIASSDPIPYSTKENGVIFKNYPDDIPSDDIKKYVAKGDRKNIFGDTLSPRSVPAHQMRFEDYKEAWKNWTGSPGYTDDGINKSDLYYKKAIDKAIAEGKTIHPDVMKDYNNLDLSDYSTRKPKRSPAYEKAEREGTLSRLRPVEKTEIAIATEKASPDFLKNTFPIEIDGEQYRIDLEQFRDGQYDNKFKLEYIHHIPQEQRNRYHKYLIEPHPDTQKTGGLYNVYEVYDKSWVPHSFGGFPTNDGIMVDKEGESFKQKLELAIKKNLPKINSTIINEDPKKIRPIFFLRERLSGNLPKNLSSHFNEFVNEIQRVAKTRQDIAPELLKKLKSSGAEEAYVLNVIHKGLSPLSPETSKPSKEIIQRLVNSIDKARNKAAKPK